MNNDYSSTGFKFSLAGITRTTNSAWFNDNDAGGMRAALHRGDYKTLNIYYLNLAGDVLGACELPTKPTASVIQNDGCVIYYGSTPGGSAKNYNLGHTTTHEAGHWLGMIGNECIIVLLNLYTNSLTLGRSLPHFPGRLHWR